MNDNYTKRMMLVFVLIFGFMIVTMYLIPKNNVQQVQQAAATNNVATATGITNTVLKDEMAYNLKKNLRFASSGSVTNLTVSYSNLMTLTVNTYGARLEQLVINGKWNRKKTPISIINPSLDYKTGDLVFGYMDTMASVTNRPVYSVNSLSSNSIVLSAVYNYKNTPVRVTKTYTVLENYQFVQNIEIRNLSSEPVKIDFGGSSFSVVSSFEFFPKTAVNSSNPLTDKYFDGNELKQGLTGGFMKARDRISAVKNPRWLSLEDNYFMTVMKPEFGDFTGKYILAKEEKNYSQIAYGAELSSIFLDRNEAKNFKISFYAGPKKESILAKADKSYTKVFDWWGIFNYLMKPIEWGTTILMDFLGSFIANAGLVIIVLSLLIKLVLSPLSIKAAVSVKRMNLLQPKIKNLQEKYKDDSKSLNEKTAELYKKEGVNPLGGCFPMLLQIPVFFALYRVLSTSVELKGAAFLWIKDLTQPDTLFTMSIPFLPTQFNLLPLIMTGIQIVQMRLQAMKGMGNSQQNALNTYLMPIIFLFLFWNMPSGLVLYWTVQNIYTIIEQEVVNVDKKVNLV